MSGKRAPAPGPVDLTQQDVDALAGGRRPAHVTRQIRATRVPPAARARRSARTGNPAPPSLKRNELLALRKGRPSAAVQKRLFVQNEPEDYAERRTPAGRAEKSYPSQEPPAGPRKQR